jgi:hypothetical protein
VSNAFSCEVFYCCSIAAVRCATAAVALRRSLQHQQSATHQEFLAKPLQVFSCLWMKSVNYFFIENTWSVSTMWEIELAEHALDCVLKAASSNLAALQNL